MVTILALLALCAMALPLACVALVLWTDEDISAICPIEEGQVW